MKKVLIGTITTKGEEVTDFETKKVETLEEVDGLLVHKSHGQRLQFKTEKGVETYFKRRNRKANFVKLVNAGEYPKHDAGNNWFLSSGQKVTGKDEAHKLEPTL